MRARHAGELTHDLRTAMAMRLAAHARRWQGLRHDLDAFDLRRRLGGIRTRLVAVDGRLSSAAARRSHTADARLRSAAARLESLSPLRVLARGYAVAFTADGTVIRSADTVRPGQPIAVRVEHGQIDCTVNDRRD
jgi:exodeoxyribonuclease VII large subunit